MWSNVVEETGEPGENHQTWTGDHYPATCLDPDSNPDRSDTTWRRRVSDRIMTSLLLVRFSVSKPGSPRFARRAAFFFCVSWVNKFSNCHKIKFPLQSSTWFRKLFLSMINHCHQKNRILITAKLYPTRCRQSHILYFAGKIFMTIFRFLKPLPHRSDYFKSNCTFLLIF